MDELKWLAIVMVAMYACFAFMDYSKTKRYEACVAATQKIEECKEK